MVSELSIDENVAHDYSKPYILQCKDDKAIDSVNSIMIKEVLDNVSLKV